MANKRDAFDILASDLAKIQRKIALDVLRDINDGKTMASVMGSSVVYHGHHDDSKIFDHQKKSIFIKLKRFLLHA